MHSPGKLLIFFLLFIVAGTRVEAQVFDQTERKFKEGVSLYNLGRYDLAMSQFADLTSRGANTQFAPLAHYYYGLAANKIKKYNESNNMLLQLLSRYPGWEEKDEALYLLGANYLALQDYKRGFDYLNQ
ncbi:MAG: tetratricopeptide repeat protein, partial [Bacteroidetes bacterium]|nr:tetratricopeptide repeat protein [Bacteroidota bacterium]